MEQKNRVQHEPLYSLIPLNDFKAILSVDDREDALSRYCLVTATYSIEHYYNRRLLRRKNTDYLTFTGDPLFTLREYPVGKVLSVHAAESRVDREQYHSIPDEGICEDLPFSLVFHPPLALNREELGIKVRYTAGYSPGKVPPDLASACLELAAWSMSRYRGKRIGMTGNVRGNGKDGEHLEASIPENVHLLLEPYKRRMI
jgi:hypothetical protein